MLKIGTEILVNTQTLYDQTLAQTAKLNNGGFVTVWVDWASSIDTTVADGSWSGIKAQILSANGSKVGAEIQVNSATINWQQDPHVAVLRNGNFVVTWTDGWDYFSWADHPGSLGIGGATGDVQGKAIKAQVFSASGAPIGSEVLVNAEMRNDQTLEKVVALANGNFVVAWEDWSLSCRYDANGNLISCGGGPGIKAQMFNASGVKVGSELAVTGSYNYSPQITALANGGFVVVWIDDGNNVDDVWAQVYSASGAKVGTGILVNTAGTGATYSVQNEEQVTALSNGGFVVTWTDLAGVDPRLTGDDSGRGVKSQVFDSSGARVGSEILVNTATFSHQFHPKAAALKNGGFVVTWDDMSNETGLPGSSSANVNAQVFDNQGGKVGLEIVVNTTLPGFQSGTQITALDDGGFAVSWVEQWSEIKAQAFDSLGNKVGAEIAANTTTEGGQDGAQITALDHGSFVVAWNDNLYGPSDGSGSSVKAQVVAPGQTLAGTSGNDTLSAVMGHAIVNALGGQDTVVLPMFANVFTLTQGSAGRVSGSYGTDTPYSLVLNDVEFVRFGAEFQTTLPLSALVTGAAQLQLGRLTDLYLAFFGRAPDTSGLEYWQERLLEEGRDFATISKDFAWSLEAQALFPLAASNREFVRTAYLNCFGRQPDPGGWDYWTARLDGLGVTDLNDRGAFVGEVILGAYATSSGEEDRALLTNRHDAAMYYVNQLSKTSAEGFDAAINTLLAKVNGDAGTQAKAELVIDYAFTHPVTLTGVMADQALLDSIWGA